MTTLTSNISLKSILYKIGNIFQHHLMKLTVRMIKLITFALQTLPIKIINAIILYYTCFIIEKLKTAAVHPNDCREMKLTVKGK